MQIIETENAPPPVGAYNQGVVEGNRVYVSGQVGMDPATGEVVSDDLGEQTTQAVENIGAVLDAAGSSLDNALKVTVYVTDISKFGEFNEAYGEAMPEPHPSRSAIEAGDLYSPYKVEIDVIAALE